jgi:hypothetical protein
MSPVIIRDADFKPVRTSRNLRGILIHSNLHAVDRVDIWPKRDSAQLGVTWVDGSSCITDFADPRVCKDWVASRRAFKGVRVVIHAGPGE